MGKIGRIACIFTPYALTIASLICIIIVGVGCTKASSSTQDNHYFIRINLQNISTGSETTQKVENFLSEHHISNVSPSEVSDIVSQLQHDSGLKDFYSIGLWGYCDGSVTNNKYDTTFCSKPQSEFYFDPLVVWNLQNTNVPKELPADYGKAMNAYKAVSKWMFVAYMIAFVTNLLELLVGIFAIFSRWGSCVTTLVSIVAFLFITAASVTSTVLFTTVKGAAEGALRPYGITTDLGGNMFATTWLAVAFALGGALFWMFSTCCCSGRSPYNHRDRHSRRRQGSFTAEKAPYTYEPLGPGQHHGNNIPMTHQQPTAYEPFRHV